MPLDATDGASHEALLVLYANGDPTAASALNMRLTPRIFGLARWMLNDAAEAEDVTQEAMLRLWRVAPDWRQGEARVATWLYRVASNLVTDRLRRKKGVALDAIAEPEDDTPGVEERLQSDARKEALDRALADLPERQRLAVVLRHIEGLANPAIADVMDLSVEAVESLIARGKRALADRLLAQRDEIGLEG